MRKIIIAVLILIIVSSSIPLTSIARTNTSALSVVLTYPYAEYSVGDVVRVQAHVFRHSSRFDPDVIDFRIGVDLRQLSMERMSPGLYEADLEILEPDLNQLNNLRLEINVTRSGPPPEMDAFKTWLRLPEYPTYSVRTYLLDPSDAFPKYGQVVEFQVICRYGDQLVDPDPGSMRVTVDQYNGVFKETVEVTRVSTGLFRGNWTVSVDMNDADMYFIDGWARFSGETAHRMGSLDIFVSPIDVWINFIHVSASAIDADIYVHKDHQTPVEGAQVSLEIFFDDSEEPDDLVILETGANGVANVRLDLEDVDPTPYEVTMVVKVQSDGISHEAFWTVGTDPVYAGRGFSKSGFAVTALDDMPIPAGAQVSLDFIATHDAEPLGNRSIECYLYTDHEMLLSTMVHTDAEGLFKLELTTPHVSERDDWYGVIIAQFKLDTGNGEDWTGVHLQISNNESWFQWNDLRTPWTQLEIERTSSPDRYNVTMRSPGLDGIDERVGISWLVGDYVYLMDATDPGWFTLTHQMYPLVAIQDLTWNGQAYTGTIEIPYFLPASVNISVTGYVEDIYTPEEVWGWAYVHDLYSYIDDPPPEVKILSPSNGDLVDGPFSIRGTASDDRSVQSVLVRLDGNEWEQANGTENWRLDIENRRLSEGAHQIEVMAFDGSKYSQVHEVEIDYSETEPRTNTPWPIIILLVLIVGAISSLYLRRAGRDKGTD